MSVSNEACGNPSALLTVRLTERQTTRLFRVLRRIFRTIRPNYPATHTPGQFFRTKGERA